VKMPRTSKKCPRFGVCSGVSIPSLPWVCM
jgi:hypothetical protein